LARCCGGSWRYRYRAGSTPIAVAKSGAEGGGSEQCPKRWLRGSKWGSSDGKNEPSEPCDIPGACSVHQFLVSRVEEALGCASQRAKWKIPVGGSCENH
jgi:hypothetical protein